jgi:hypothetical protein
LRTSAPGTVLTGHALESQRTSYALDRSVGRMRSTSIRLTFQVVDVWSTTATRYPQAALVESRILGKKYARYRALHHLARHDAGSPWLVALAAYPETDVLARPVRGRGDVAVEVPPDTRFAGLRLDRLSSALAAALDEPTSKQGRLFAGRPRRDLFSGEAQPGQGPLL